MTVVGYAYSVPIIYLNLPGISILMDKSFDIKLFINKEVNKSKSKMIDGSK